MYVTLRVYAQDNIEIPTHKQIRDNLTFYSTPYANIPDVYIEYLAKKSCTVNTLRLMYDYYLKLNFNVTIEVYYARYPK